MRLFGRGSQELVAGLQCIDGQKVITVDDAVVRIVRWHDPHSHWQHDGEGHSKSQSDDGDVSRLGETSLWLSEVVTPDHIAAGRHVVVVHPSLRNGDLESVHADSVEVFQHGLHADAA